MLWILLLWLKKLPILLVKYLLKLWQEFDTYEDVIAFEPDFVKYRDVDTRGKRE